MALRRLLAAVPRFEQQPRVYCARCGGHYPAHSH